MGARVGGLNWKVVSFLAFVTQAESLRVCTSMQLDNPDEQAAQIRRELDGRLQMADQIARVRTLGTFARGPDQCSTHEDTDY